MQVLAMGGRYGAYASNRTMLHRLISPPCAAVCTGAPDHDARDSERATGWDMASQVRSFCDMHAHVRGVRRFCSCHQHGLCDCGCAIAAHADRTGRQARQAGPCMPWRDMTLQEGLLFELDAMLGG